MPATDTCWWLDAPGAVRFDEPSPRAAYRFGDVVLEVRSAYAPLLDELENAYGDCGVPRFLGSSGSSVGRAPRGTRRTRNRGTPATARVVCCAKAVGESLVGLRFAAPHAVPPLCDVALSLLRPRAELSHFAEQPSGIPAWRLIANARDERAPLLIADERSVVIDMRLEPPEFLLNLVVGVAQLADESMLYVHGGGVVIDGCGTLLVGRSGQGKSTTTVALAGRGHPLLGDETVAVRAASAELRPFARTLKLRPGPSAEIVAERLRAVPHAKRIDAVGTECDWVRPRALFPDATPPESAPLTDVFFLRDFRDRAAAERFTPTLGHLDELQAMTMSLSAVVSWPHAPAHRLMRFVRMTELFSKCRCYFLDLGTPDETAALIERTVRNHAQRS